jgi:CO/xanthine dehydrogenase FAD-binding subunit
MRAYLPDYRMSAPRDLAAVLELLEKEPGVWKPFAGGTDLMVLFEAGKLAHKNFLSLWHLNDLKKIEESASEIQLGALVTYSQIRNNAVLSREFPMLAQAAAETGAVAIQNRGTIAGNIANASPAADTPPALLVYEAEIELTSSRGSRWIPIREFFLAYKKTALRPEELITRVKLKRGATGLRHYYRKVGTRKAQAISKVCFAGLAQISGATITWAKISLGSVAPVSLRCSKTEALLLGQKLSPQLIASARAALAAEIAPLDDIRSTRSYRLTVAQNLLESFLKGLS